MADNIKIYIFNSPSHDEMKHEFFLPSLQDDFEIVEEVHPQSCNSGEYHSEGWNEVVLQKVNLIIRAIRENWGSWFVHSDVDVQFFGKVESLLCDELKNHDIVFQNDCPYPRPVACAGFFACRGNDVTLNLWKMVRDMCQRRGCDDQESLNLILHDRLLPSFSILRWRVLPIQFYSVGAVASHFLKIVETNSSDNLMSKDIKFDPSWRWPPNSNELADSYVHPSMSELHIPHDIVMHHANYTEGIDNKIKQLEHIRKCVLKH